MKMVTQVSLDCNLSICLDNLGNKDGNSSAPSSSQDQAAPQMPVKKQTRQWAAWTRQEEESFFAALRLVGKNFEKITSRVQSKNKDQVRHYYYRLVRRMNKLLGPELCLDAKNSKDTNAAMLRWWSLLEKYSCKASKLHLKPRRFKIFVETLENQLLRDRKKNSKKRLCTGENNSSMPNIANQVRASGHDNRAVKMVLLDGQNIEKVGNGKGSLFKRPANMGMNRTNCKLDQAAVRSMKHRRKTGLASSAAYKRWEKAAIAGVSLVADAAEQLERVDTDKESECYQETPGLNGSHLVGEMTRTLRISPQSTLNENNIQNPAKLKLQLFPIDESTQKALETDHHNPHLELTLSTRKKISSVLEHLNRKWGNSSSLNQELLLFPYWAQKENLVGYQKWTKDSTLCAADVHYLLGSPPVFRLRYGWFSEAEIESMTAQALSCNINEATKQNTETENPSSSCAYQTVSADQNVIQISSTSTPNVTIECDIPVSNVNTAKYYDDTSVALSPRKPSGDLTHARQVANTKDMALSAGEWADSLTNISMGDLLSEPKTNSNLNCSDFPGPSNCLQQIPFSCDSFDAAIAAHIYKHHNKVEQPGLASHEPSIWDAEETCDAFSFRKSSAFRGEDHGAYIHGSSEAPKIPSASEVKELPEVEKLTSSNTCEDFVDQCISDNPLENPANDLAGLADIYWADSLGPLDLDTPSCRYQSNDLILSDSLGGLNRLIANSLDAFQSCSFFGSDKKEAVPKEETHQNVSFSDFKIGSEV